MHHPAYGPRIVDARMQPLIITRDDPVNVRFYKGNKLSGQLALPLLSQ